MRRYLGAGRESRACLQCFFGERECGLCRVLDPRSLSGFDRRASQEEAEGRRGDQAQCLMIVSGRPNSAIWTSGAGCAPSIQRTMQRTGSRARWLNRGLKKAATICVAARTCRSGVASEALLLLFPHATVEWREEGSVLSCPILPGLHEARPEQPLWRWRSPEPIERVS